MNTNKLKEVLSIQSYSGKQFRMFAYIIRQCKSMNVSFYVNSGNIYITKGISDNYPCIIAHMDTVHQICEDLTVIDVNGNLTAFNAVKMYQTGIGGDDKVGIYIALECLKKSDTIKVAFFSDEEIGCIGSYDADIDFFDNCNFVLQCDRKGNNDFITSASSVTLSSKHFQKSIKKTIKSFGYKFTYGFMTDVMALKEMGIECSMANISCGYYNPHCINEYVNIKDVANCLDLVFSLIDKFGNTYFNHKYEHPKYYNYKDNFVFPKTKIDNCDCCMEDAATSDLTYIREYNMYACAKCCKWAFEEEIKASKSNTFQSISNDEYEF